VTVHVVVAEDQQLVRAGLVMLLDAEDGIDVVGECDNGEEAVHLAHLHHPDVVLMDLAMPRLDGVEATRRICRDRPEDAPDPLTKVLVVTTFADDEAVYGALRAGASGFVLKHAAPRDLVAAVRHVAAGEAWLDPAVAGRVIAALGSVPGLDTAPGAAVDRLTPREREVLALMAHGLSNGEITERLVVSEATVKTHVARILMKTGARDRAQAVVVAYTSGLVAPPPR